MTTKIKNLKKIKSKPLHRSFEIARSEIDEKERTVPLSFSSEDPYQRWFGVEILDHSKSSVDLSRLNNSAPILSEHDRRVQIGVVVKGTAKIDTDKTGRLVAKFGSSKKAKSEFQDVIDGIRTKISVGYRVHEMVLEGKKDGEEIYRVTQWEPFEVSLVSIPADDTVGIGKTDESSNNSITIIGKTMTEAEKAALAAEKKANQDKLDLKKLATDARRSEVDRIRAINLAASEFKAKGFDVDEIALKHIQSGSEFSEFKIEMLEDVTGKQAAIRQDSNIGATDKEIKNYSLFKALTALKTGNWKDAGFERECSQAVEDKIGKDARGIYIPGEAQTLIRAQNTGAATAGGNLVATELQAQSFIDILRSQSVLNQLGATNLYGLVGKQSIPKRTSSASAFWVAEGVDSTDSEGTFDLLSMEPTTVSAAVPITRRMQLQSTPDIEALVWSDMARVLALAIDDAGFEGDGLLNKPLGITGAAGVNTQAVASAGAPTWAEMVGFETAIAADNNLQNAMSYVTTAAVRGSLKTTKKDAGSGIFLMENGKSNDYDVILKNSLTANRIIFGYFADLLIGHWGVLDAVIDESTLAKSGGMVARFFQDLDILVRQEESFCINA